MKDIPAFPSTGVMVNEGMSLRDYFAGQALMGLCVNTRFIEIMGKRKEELAVLSAIISYEIARAMLAEREKL